MSFLRRVVGAFASPIATNPTSEMVNAAFGADGLPYLYVNFDIDASHLPTAIIAAKALGFAGFNLSRPNKVAILPFLDHLDASAIQTGAVNTVVLDEEGAKGYNTDGEGFLRALEQVHPVADISVMLFGAGGAARAIAVELAKRNIQSLTIVARNLTAAAQLRSLVQASCQSIVELLAWPAGGVLELTADLIVNATPLGSYEELNTELPLIYDGARTRIIADVSVNPARTRLLEKAAATGIQVLDGRSMLVNQAARNIELWTGRQPDLAIMRHALDLALAIRSGGKDEAPA